MKKNQDGTGLIEILLVFLVVSLIGGGIWLINNAKTSKTLPAKKTTTVTKPNPQPGSSATQQSTATPNPKSSPQVAPQSNPLNVTPVDYPKPTTPRNFKVIAASGGYDLSWEASAATTSIAKYQIFY